MGLWPLAKYVCYMWYVRVKGPLSFLCYSSHTCYRSCTWHLNTWQFHVYTCCSSCITVKNGVLLGTPTSSMYWWGVLHLTQGCYIEYYLGVIEYYLGAAGVRTSAILTVTLTLQICSYTPQISPLTFATLWFSTATRPIQVSMHHVKMI